MFAAYWCLSLESLLARPSLLWFIVTRRYWVSLSLTRIISRSCPDFVPVLMSDNPEAIKQNTLNMTGLKCNLHGVQTMKDYSLLQVFFWLGVLYCVFICKTFSYIETCSYPNTLRRTFMSHFIKTEGFSSDSSPSQMYYSSYNKWINQLIN